MCIRDRLGIICTAPIDGHDIGLLKETLATVLHTDVPVLMHVVTRKGAGYAPAVQNPETVSYTHLDVYKRQG